MKPLLLLLLLLSATPACVQPTDAPPKNVVLIAGPKSHGPGLHEYVKTVRLLKAMLDAAGEVSNLRTEVVLDGWPDDPATLDDADLIVTISDGADGELYDPVPFMTEERMAVMARQMERGCGFMTFHFSTFAPDALAPQILEWGGGYFDWQDSTGARNWYSAIETLDTLVAVGAPEHPIARGIPETFDLYDEFYYNIRFREADPRLQPILRVPALASERPLGDIVAWAVDRADGGRGFGTTTGHFYRNWQHPHYRKLILNAVAWTAGAEVPPQGVDAPFMTDAEVAERLFGTRHKALILTGNNHPAHDWQATTPVIREALAADGRFVVDVSTDIHDLGEVDLSEYDVLALNYANWQDPQGLGDRAKEAFAAYLAGGGGLLVLHFANGAFHRSLPEAGISDWPEYRRIVRRVWDHDDGSAHDAYDRFQVQVASVPHEITQGLDDFWTTDELYYNQRGDAPIEPLLTAHSKDTGRDEPMAWAYSYGEGRVFQTVLGHGVDSLTPPEVQRLLLRAARWVARVP